MKRMKRAFAMLMCVAMVLSLCTMFAGADEVLRYDTLDAIPEDVKIFRSIRTGAKTYIPPDNNGNSYYQFWEPGYPKVQIKTSAFMAEPKNDYLNADNISLSQHCKDTPPQVPAEQLDEWSMANWSATRVCYYKTQKVRDVPRLAEPAKNKPARTVRVYTTSMYRLELGADADFTNQIKVGAKVTSGVTFVYNTDESVEYALTRKPEKDSIRPSVSVAVSSNSQDVRLKDYSISAKGSQGDASAAEIAEISANTLGCVKSIVDVVGAKNPKGIVEAVSTCTPVIAAVSTTSKARVYVTRIAATYQPIVASPIRFTNSDDTVFIKYTLNCNFDKANTNFLIAFSFE